MGTLLNTVAIAFCAICSCTTQTKREPAQINQFSLHSGILSRELSSDAVEVFKIKLIQWMRFRHLLRRVVHRKFVHIPSTISF